MKISHSIKQLVGQKYIRGVADLSLYPLIPSVAVVGIVESGTLNAWGQNSFLSLYI